MASFAAKAATYVLVVGTSVAHAQQYSNHAYRPRSSTFFDSDASQTSTTTTTPSLSFLAFGDWGATPLEVGLASRLDDDQLQDPTFSKIKHLHEYMFAHENIGYAAGLVSQDVKFTMAMLHGDNFYDFGISDPKSERFKISFENKFKHPSLMELPYHPVAGNHDVGHNRFLCTTGEKTPYGDDFILRECKSVEEVKEALKMKFDGQIKYRSPNNDRWDYKAPSYVTHHEGRDGVSVNVFHLETNFAEHRIQSICCQCNGYKTLLNDSSSINCRNVHRGLPGCAPNPFFDACYNYLSDLYYEGLDMLKEGLDKSTATFNFVHTHYHRVYHFSKKQQQEIEDVVNGRVQAWICGHSHYESHEYSPSANMHFMMNGAGGGAPKDKPMPLEWFPNRPSDFTMMWSAGEFGFLTIHARPTEAEFHFIGFDKPTWGDFSPLEKGFIKVLYCYIVPVDGSVGRQCDAEEAGKMYPTARGLTKQNSGLQSSSSSLSSLLVQDPNIVPPAYASGGIIFSPSERPPVPSNQYSISVFDIERPKSSLRGGQ